MTRTDYPKIDIYILNRGRHTWQYECSTTWAKTLKQAKRRFLIAYGFLSSDQVKAKFSNSQHVR